MSNLIRSLWLGPDGVQPPFRPAFVLAFLGPTINGNPYFSASPEYPCRLRFIALGAQVLGVLVSVLATMSEREFVVHDLGDADDALGLAVLAEEVGSSEPALP